MSTATASAVSTTGEYFRAQEATVRHLGELYTIVVGLSLSTAVADLFVSRQATTEDDLATWALLAGFVVTLIPYYHGTLRHLERYRPPAPPPVHRGALLVDFAFIFLQGCLFFALARHVALPRAFGAILWILLVSNVIWVVVTRLILFREAPSLREAWKHMRESPSPEHRVPREWLLNNAVFIGLLAVGWWGARPGTGCGDIVVAGLVALLCLFRTWRDYQTAWEFYFPAPPTGEESDAAARDGSPEPTSLRGWKAQRA